jgi:S1-C subfamily serine protease
MQGRKPVIEGKRLAGTGTGFAVAADGHVLTNAHVIDGCQGISVTPPDAEPIVASLVAADAPLDLALLKAAAPLQGVATIREQPLPAATDVAVVGYPLHGKVAIRPIFVEGIVDVSRVGSADRFVLSIDIRKGNSGGPVLDRSGNIVGVVVAKVNTPAVYAKTGETVRDVGFAIRPSTAANFLRRNGVSPAAGAPGAELTDEQLFDHARRLVAQIGCWK